MHFLKRKPVGATWLGRTSLNKVNGGRFSIHQNEAAPFEIFHYVTTPSRSKLALVLRHQTVQAVQFFAYFLPRGVLGVTIWHIANLLNARGTINGDAPTPAIKSAQLDKLWASS